MFFKKTLGLFIYLFTYDFFRLLEEMTAERSLNIILGVDFCVNVFRNLNV